MARCITIWSHIQRTFKVSVRQVLRRRIRIAFYLFIFQERGLWFMTRTLQDDSEVQIACHPQPISVRVRLYSYHYGHVHLLFQNYSLMWIYFYRLPRILPFFSINFHSTPFLASLPSRISHKHSKSSQIHKRCNSQLKRTSTPKLKQNDNDTTTPCHFKPRTNSYQHSL